MKITDLKKEPSQRLSGPGVEYNGVSKQLPIGTADGAPNFSMRVFTLDPGGFSPHHKHPWEHEVYVLSGKGVAIDDDGAEYPIEEGSFIFVPPDDMHQFRNASETEQFQFICIVPKEHE
ncbi:MAG: cupin domain-containing protein [Alkalispirochaeta sp.]